MIIFTVYVMEWMLDIQLGRRNLSPIQRIAIAEKYRPIYEKQAKNSQGARNDLKDNFPQNLGESERKKLSKDREVNSRLAKVANVNPETYRQAKRVLDSDNEDLKQRVLSGETAISTGYKELIGKKENKNVEDNNATTTPTLSQTQKPQPTKPQISDEVRQICEDLKSTCYFLWINEICNKRWF